MRPASARERLLVVVALLVAAATAYGVFRLRPLLGALERTSIALSMAEQRLAEASWPEAGRDPERLRAERDALAAEVEALAARLDEGERRFASHAGPGAREALQIRLSGLAARHRVGVRENTVCPDGELREFLAAPREAAAAGPDARLLRELTVDDPHPLAVRRLVVHADSARLRAFLDELARVEPPLVVVRFSIVPRFDRARTLEVTLWLGT